MSADRTHRYSTVAAVIVGLLSGGLLSPARATSLTVPDEVPSIQEALDAGVDTVLVRPGSYPETPVVSRPGVLLLGAPGGPMPIIAGLRIEIYSSPVYPAVYACQGLGFVNRVVYLNARNNADITFLQCQLSSGMVPDSSGFGDTENITFANCHLDGLLHLIARNAITLDSCSGTAHLVAGVSSYFLNVRGCILESGGNYPAIYSNGHIECYVEGNTIRGYWEGVSALGEYATVSNNIVEDCTNDGITVWADSEGSIVNNVVRRCGAGVYARATTAMWIRDNLIQECVDGLEIGEADGAEVIGNISWRCSGNGMVVYNGPRQSLIVRQNTCCGNGQSGYVIDSFYGDGQEWTNNIGYGNGRYGISWLKNAAAITGCNDWFGNRAGNVSGQPISDRDYFVDPRFCNADSGDFHVNSACPLLADSACGQIGALGVGCGVTPTLVQRFTAARVGAGVRVVWEVALGATASQIWLERSDGSAFGPWVVPVTERSIDNRAVVELDRSAVPDRKYWYRLVAQEGSQSVVIGVPISVAAQAPLEFRLVQVGPNPGSGPVRIAFALKHAAAIEIDVFDVQGRKVAAPGSGVWAAGTHELAWDGRTRNGQPAPAGMYVVRYLYPGGQDRRGIVRIR